MSILNEDEDHPLKDMDFGDAPSLGSQSSDRLYALYIDEAEKYDDALAARLKTSSDSLLIFAGLFSATVTALLIESYAGLVQDSGDESVFYLVQIAQQMAANQLPPGLGNSTASSFTPFPTFETPASAVRVNVLWVLSLIVSLACALGATLVQTWTARYTRLVTQYANISDRARRREFYHEGLKRSHLIVVAEALPALLHLSLFLFLAGLVEFLLQANNVVAYIALGATVVVSLAYGILTVTPLMSTSSPYHTPLSVQLPKRLRRFLKRAWHAHFSDSSQSSKSANGEGSLRQSRALQWLLDRMTGAYNFDKFVEGLESFLDSRHGTRIIFQLNVKKPAVDSENRRGLSTHISYRLHSCLDASINIDVRRSQVKAMAGALWNLFVHLQTSETYILDDTVAPGGTDISYDHRPASQHVRQWLHPLTLHSLRRLRHDEDPVISLYATCTSMVIFTSILHVFHSQLRHQRVLVPHGWTFMRLLGEYDVQPDTEKNETPLYFDFKKLKTSFEWNVLIMCLLPPPGVGQKSQAEKTLDAFDASARPWPDLMISVGGRYEVLTPDRTRNVCRLAASQRFLDQLLTLTGSLQPTVATVDMIQKTLKLLLVGTNAKGTEDVMQRSFVGLVEKIFSRYEPPDDPPLSFAKISGRQAATAQSILEDVQSLVWPICKTLDHAASAQRAARSVYHAQIENLDLFDDHPLHVGRVVFDPQPVLESSTSYILCSENGRDFLTLTEPGASVHVLSGLRIRGKNQKWQLWQEGLYWKLKNIDAGTFLGIDLSTTLQEGTSLCVSGPNQNVTTTWTVRPVEGDSRNFFLYYADTEYAIARAHTTDLSLDAKPVLSTSATQRLQWEFARIDFRNVIKEDVAYYLEINARRMNSKSRTVLDLSGADRVSVLAFSYHGYENQKWQFTREGDYWVIQCVLSGASLDIDSLDPRDGARLICSGRQGNIWDIRPDAEDTELYNIFYAGTELAAILNPANANAGGYQVSLSHSKSYRIRWRLAECDD